MNLTQMRGMQNAIPQPAPVGEILVELKNNYGTEVIVPLCDKGKMFAELANTKTLTRRAVNIIKSLGYTVRVQRTEPEEL